jgi:hypothetical protein
VKVFEEWVKRTISKETEDVSSIASTLIRYYYEMFERKPEFMGWSRTEPTTQTNNTEYNLFFHGDEGARRITKYDILERDMRWRRVRMAGKPGEAAFYQLVYYPVVCASLMNKKFLYRDKAMFYAKQNRLSAKEYAAISKAAYDSIVKETEYYNNTLSGGKWKNIMSMKPRDLPVFKEPVIPEITIDANEGWSVAPEGFVSKDSSIMSEAGKLQLPPFDSVGKTQYFIDIFLCDTTTVNWTATANEWISLSRDSGSLTAAPGKKDQRIRVHIDWSKAPADKQFTGKIIFKGAQKQLEVGVQVLHTTLPKVSDMTEVDRGGYVVIDASRYAKMGDSTGSFQWKRYENMGRDGTVLSASLPKLGDKPMQSDLATIKKEAHFVEYPFYTVTAATPTLIVYSVPTHPVNNNFSNRYAVSVDDGPLTLVDFKTEGRSEEWKRNVLSNRAEKKVQLQYLDKGLHKLKVYCVDPGVMLEEYHIDLGGLKQVYSHW